MNQRIQELYLQAAEIAVKEEPTDLLAGQLIQMQKFAELIVKECEVALNPMLRDMVSRGHAVDLIKKHFGVEE